MTNKYDSVIRFIYSFGVLCHLQHCTGHIMMGSWKGGGKQYIQLGSGFCTVNCRPTASNYQLCQLRPCWELNPGLRGGRRECYHSATVAPDSVIRVHRTNVILFNFMTDVHRFPSYTLNRGCLTFINPLFCINND